MSENNGDNAGSEKPDDGKPKKGPKLFRASDPTPKDDKPEAGKGPKLFKASGDAPPADKPEVSKGPKLFKAGGDAPQPDKPEVSKGPKLFKAAEVNVPAPEPTPKQEISKGPKLFKAAEVGVPAPEGAAKPAPRLFKAGPSEPEKPKEEPKPLVLPSIEKKAPVLPVEEKPAEVVSQPSIPLAEPKKVEVPLPKISLPKISARPVKEVEKEDITPEKEEPREEPKEEAKDEKIESAKAVKAKLEAAKKKNIDAAKSFRKKRTGALAVLADRISDSDRMKKSFNAAFLADEIDVREMWYKSIFGGILAAIGLLFFNYFFYAFGDDHFFEQTYLFTSYSQGNPVNEVIGLWAITYTPITSFSILNAAWIDDWFVYLGPTVLSATVIGFLTKNVRYAILGCVYFAFASVLFAFTFMTVFPFFGLVDPTTIDAGIIATFPNVVESFNSVYSWILTTTNSVYFGWSVAGSLELAAFAIVFAVPMSIIANIISSLFAKEIVVAK